MIEIIDQLFEELEKEGARKDIPVILGGIIPGSDVDPLMAKGVKAVFTPKDFDLMDVMNRIMDIVDENRN